MSEGLTWLLAGGAGVVLGVFFFGGLWWTVQKALSSPRAALWMVGSFVVRMAVTVGGFYLIADGHWQRVLACLAGFLLARVVVTRITDKYIQTPEVTHAP